MARSVVKIESISLGGKKCKVGSGDTFPIELLCQPLNFMVEYRNGDIWFTGSNEFIMNRLTASIINDEHSEYVHPQIRFISDHFDREDFLWE